MKFVSKVLVFALFLLVIPANLASGAVYQGCPTEWPSPSSNWSRGSSGLPKDLEDMKSTLGFNMVVTDNGEQILIKENEWLQLSRDPMDSIAFSLVFSGNLVGRYSYTIQVANCPNAATRYYGYQDKTEVTLDKSEIDIPTYFSKAENRERFGGPSDFTKINSITPLLQACSVEMQREAKLARNDNLSAPVWTNAAFTIQPTSACNNLKEILPQTFVFFSDKNCLHMTSGYLRVGLGEVCEVLIGTYFYTTFGLSKSSVVKLTSVILKGPPSPQQIAADKAAADKAAADKAAADKAAAEQLKCAANKTQLMSVLKSLISAIESYPASSMMLSDTKQRLENALLANCVSDVTLSDFKNEVTEVIAKAKAASTKKQMTITCIKGKLVKKITALNPKCPSGYRKK